MKTNVLFPITVLTVFTGASAYNILCVFPVPSRSHATLGKGIIKPLLKAGHQVTWVTSYPEGIADKNLKIIELASARTLIENMPIKDSKDIGMAMVLEYAKNISIIAASSPAVREAMSKDKFDAVVSEWFFSDLEAGYAAVQQAPWILFSGMLMHPYVEYLVDTVRSVPTLPDLLCGFPVPMNFWQRLVNTFNVGMMFLDNWIRFSESADLYDKYFLPLARGRGVPLPPFSEAIHNVSIMLVNSHPSYAVAQSLPPNVIDIGGYHIDEETPPLPKDLQDLLDSSTQGVVYFSMGSVFKSAALPEKTKKDLLEVLGEIPYTVLWKFEEKLDNLPKNVHIRPWMPQASILSHPNVKVFITHGGLLSMLESLRHGVPIVAIPVFGDQPSNAERAVRAGHALKVQFSPDMAPALKAALDEMFSNNRYYEKAQEISRLFNNRVVKPEQLIVHYVELAIESKGAYHLRSKAKLYKWYELWMLDQIAFVLAVLLAVYLIIRKIFRLLTKKPDKGRKGKKE